jgi:hypothetical protein
MVVEAGIRDPDLLHDHASSGRLGDLLLKRERPRRHMRGWSGWRSG